MRNDSYWLLQTLLLKNDAYIDLKFWVIISEPVLRQIQYYSNFVLNIFTILMQNSERQI